VKDQRTFIGSYTSGQITNSIMKTRSYAAFGEVSYDITPTTHLTGGLRYTKEKRTLDAQQFSFTPTTTTLILAAPLVNKIDFNRVTYRAAIRQDITDDINIYASYNRGFKSGLWAIQSPGGPPVKPQTTDAFEVGIKSELFDRLLRFNLAGYHYKIKDYQIRAAPGNAANPILLNATSVKVNGIEGEVQLAPAQGLLFTGNFNYLPKSKFGTFNGAPFTFPNTVLVPASTPAATACASPNLGLGARTGGNRTCLMSATGLRTPLSPKFTMSAGMSYTTPVGNDGELSFNLLFSHNSGYYFEQDNRLEQGSFQVVNGSIGWKVTKNWGVELWAKNIGKEKYYITKLGSGTADHGELQPPRTYGMNFTFDF
jgi:iron complex outermembrane receptor protein